MVAEIIVAVACNLIAVLLLTSGIITAKSNGIKVTLIKLFGTLGGLVGGYFVAPVITNKLYSIEGFEAFVSNILGASVGTLNSCLFFLFFILVYAITIIVCNIVKHCLVKRMQDKKINKLKMKRAKSINPKAERAVRKAEWKLARAKYMENRRWYHKVLSCFVGAIIAIVVGIVTLMPYGFIAKDINKEGDKEYLTKGFEYTLNGLIPDSFFDWVVHANNMNEDDGCDHEYEEGTCIHCGELEVSVVE